MAPIDRRDLIRGSLAGSLALLAPGALAASGEGPALSRIAFGSCARQDKEQPIWDRVNAWNPELFIFLGDNIYADTEDMGVMRDKYARLAAKPGFQQ
jgi:alkaline phosphatase D